MTAPTFWSRTRLHLAAMAEGFRVGRALEDGRITLAEARAAMVGEETAADEPVLDEAALVRLQDEGLVASR